MYTPGHHLLPGGRFRLQDPQCCLCMLSEPISFFYFFQLSLFLLTTGSPLFAPILHLRDALVDFCSALCFQHYLVSARIAETQFPSFGKAVNPIPGAV